MTAHITDNGDVSEAFAVTDGVKQGCVPAPILFGLMFSAMLMDAYRGERPGIRITYRTDGRLFNQRRILFQSRLSTITAHELLFADHCALNTTSEEDMQRTMDLFSAAREDLGLIINTEKTVVMHQPSPNTAPPYNAPEISLNGTQLLVVDIFPYLGSTLSRSTKIDDEVARWTSKASQAFVRLQSTVLNRHGLQPSAKPKTHKTVILRILLYGAENWTVYTNQAPRLNHLRLTCLRRILNLLAGSYPRLGRTGVDGNPQHLRHTKTTTTTLERHLVQMVDEQLPKRLFDGNFATGSRRQGRQVRRYKDTLNTYLERLQIIPANWKDLGRDRPTGRSTVKTGGVIFEANCITVAKAKR
nr:unnamed protein product [Spirometra erinaceieuropaei]